MKTEAKNDGALSGDANIESTPRTEWKETIEQAGRAAYQPTELQRELTSWRRKSQSRRVPQVLKLGQRPAIRRKRKRRQEPLGIVRWGDITKPFPN